MRALSALVGICILSVAFGQAGRPAYICEVLLENFCAGVANCPSDPTIHFGNAAYAFENFNLVSFDSFYATSGDVEGRAIIRNKLNLPNGQYSFGYESRTGGASAADNSLPYALVVGGDANWQGGAVYPDGSNFPYAGAKEDFYVGGTFTGPATLATRRSGGPCATAGCLNADFDNAQAYYTELSKEFDAQPDNAQIAIQYSGATITCNSKASATYYVHISPADFSTITYFNPALTCNPNSAIVFNIKGAGNQVKFAGATQTIFKNERTVYNVVAATSTPSVRVEVGVNGNLLAPQSQYNQPHMGVFIGQVIVANVVETLQINRIFCAPQAPPVHPPSTSNLCPSWETACGGMDLTLNGQTFSFRDFNAVSMSDFTANTGDVEGRLAVKRDAKFGCGYSVGDKLQTAVAKPDNSLPYSLIVGRDLNWCSGALYPFGDGIPFPGNQENMFVGGNFTTAQNDLVARNKGPCTSGAGCFDQEFDDAKACYTGYASAMTAQADNVDKNIEWSGLAITCRSASATDYVVSLTPAEMALYTYTTLGNCNFQARWTINVKGTGDVEITGASFPAIPGGTVYNIQGVRNVWIHDTDLAGALLAPDATVTQGGVINGKVVAGNIVMSTQINRQNACPTPVPVTIPVVVVKPSIQASLVQFSNNALRVGDQISSGVVVKEYRGDNTYELSKPVSLNEGQVIFVKVQSDQGRAPEEAVAAPADNAATSVTMAFAVVVALIALAF